MSQQLLIDVQKAYLKKVPEIRAGYTVKIHQKIKEGSKERIQIFEGLVIKVGSGNGIDKTFTVRKVVDGIGVEKVFPLHSGTVKKIEVVKKAKVARAKLYYMRKRFGKSARLSETHVSSKDEVIEEVEEVKAEDVVVEGEEVAVEKEETPKEEAEKVEEEVKKEEEVPKEEEKAEEK